MKLFVGIVAVALSLSLGGCTKPEEYPVSGDQCGPNDPVKGLSASDCIPPAGV